MADEAQNAAPEDIENPDGTPDAAPVEAATAPQTGAAEEPVLQACATCDTELDVSDEEPFAQVRCPVCNATMRARTQIKNFALIEVLGAGGMGAVYKARDENLNRQVALKVVRKEYSSDPVYIAKFEREARITASVAHPNVVKVFSFGSEHGLYYIAMELVDKGSLDDLMSLQGRVAEIQVLDVGLQVAQGLRAAHERGLIHRDVKPGNILFSDARTAKIVDFGLALLAEHEAEERGEVWGTPYYVAPEKLEHLPEDFRSDIYSLGATLFHAASGRPPFEAETASLVALKHLKSTAVSIQAFAPDITSATAYVINRMLNKDPNQRYQSYDELIEHLQYAKSKIGDAAAKPRDGKARVVVQSERHQSLMGLVTLLMLVIMIGVGIGAYLFRDRLFHKTDTSAARDAAAASAASAASAEADMAKYQSARKQMVDGDFTGAQDAFKQLGEQGLAQPLQNWVTLHEGLSALLAGKLADARAAFQMLKDRGTFSNDGANVPLANFFVETAQLAADDQPVPPDVAKKFNQPDFHSVALFVFALKDWELGRFEDANTLFTAFLAAEPAGTFAWIGDYKPVAQKYAADFAAYKKIADAGSAADTPEARAELLTQVSQLKPQARGRLLERVSELEQEFKKRNSPAEVAKHEAEVKSLADARRKFAAACANYQFTEARAAVQGAAVTERALTQEKATLLKKAEWLQRFKATLVNDLTAAGYPEPLRKKDGATIPGGVKRASEAQFDVQTQYGSAAVPWSEVAPAPILAMANYFTSKAAGFPDYAADRTWLSGVFAFQLGLQKEARDLLTRAAGMKVQYQDQLTLFFDPNTGEAIQ